MKNTLGVALTKCYYCNDDSDIIINRTLTESRAKQVEGMHGKVVDMRPCNACKAQMEKGIILITIDEEKSDRDWDRAEMPNPYRTGGFFVVTEDAVKRLFPESHLPFMLKYRWMFIEHEAAEKIGLFATVPTQT